MIPAIAVLNEVVALFAVAVVIAYLCYRLRLATAAGFLIAGVLIGPSALGLISDQELVDVLAEIGVILLLFSIGVEFSITRLGRLRREMLVTGSIQVVLTVALVAVGLAMVGVAWGAGIYTGCLIALSSTAIVLTLLAERNELETPAGKISLAVLIFQDLAIVAMVLLVPMLSGEGGGAGQVIWALARAILVITVVLVLARQIVPWILERVVRTKRQELFLLTIVAICFGTAALADRFGISLALGAFLAGLIVSESKYSQYALSEVLPLKMVFNAVFFVSIGMLMDLGFVFERPGVVLGVAGAVVVLKIFTTMVGVKVLGYPARIAVVVGLTLAQVGEFSFVLERVGSEAGIFPAGAGESGEQVFIAAAVLLMLLTPLLSGIGERVGWWISDRLHTPRVADQVPDESVSEEIEDHVVIVGHGQAGGRLTRVLEESSIPFRVVDLNPQTVQDHDYKGDWIVFGDASRPHILEEAGIERAKLCVLTISDTEAALRILTLARHLNPTVQLVTRTRFIREIDRLNKAGADIVVPEEMETTVRIFSHVLGAYMVPPQEIDRLVRVLRSEDYGVLRGSIQEAHLMVLQGLDEEGLHTRAVAVRPGAPADGKTLGDLSLRRDHKLTVLAVRRGHDTIANPSGEFRVEVGDRLVLVGSADRFSECSHLFRTPTTGN